VAVSGTCEGACEHYVECKGAPSADQHDFDVCVAECQDIFVDHGRTDHESLSDFENLDCDDTVAFVDGEDQPDSIRMAEHRTASDGQSKAR
jgi:hypothetical protein